MEPRLVIFRDGENSQGYIVAEQEVMFEVDGFTVVDGLISLIASYYSLYISYPKSTIAAMELLFIQEALLGVDDGASKKTVKYASLINSTAD